MRRSRLKTFLLYFAPQFSVYTKFGIDPDILGIDTAGDLYVIELKKDSGYDDAYAQTREYIDWIEEDVAVKGQRVFGIICLNDPTKDLIEKVKADDQMRLFEYSISYSEII